MSLVADKQDEMPPPSLPVSVSMVTESDVSLSLMIGP